MSMTFSSVDTGVPGFKVTPAFLPSARIACSERWMCGPGLDMHGDDVGAGLGEGLEIGIARRDHQMHVEGLGAECGRSAFTTPGPIEIFGTKCPSITSTWIQSAPAASMARTSSPSLAKSADRIEGEMMSGRGMSAGLQIAVRVT